ncbi:MAG: plastocyanin/azurin family copper-binding protein [Actinomycetota bacterium]
MTFRLAVAFQLRSTMVNFRRAPFTLVACLALGAFGAGCGGDDEESSGSNPAPAEEPADSGGGAAESGGKAVKAVKVDMKDTTFVPMDATVAKGGTITWTNSDGFAHTVTKDSGPGADFDSGNVDGGATFKQKFAAAGKIDYLCEIHPGQTGTITVK